MAELSLNSGSGKPSATYREPADTERLSMVICRSGCPHHASTGVTSRSCIHDKVVHYWTFRFRLAKIEHWWWTVVSALLLVSLVLITLLFLSGNNNEAIFILALSTAAFLTIIQYMMTSWRARRFIENRWLAWTGSNKTTIAGLKAAFCSNKGHWERLAKEAHSSHAKQTPSDWYG